MNFQKIARQVWYYLLYVLEKDMAVAILKGSWAFLPLKLTVETSLVEFGFKPDCSFLAIKGIRAGPLPSTCWCFGLLQEARCMFPNLFFWTGRMSVVCSKM